MPAGRERGVSGMGVGFQEAEALPPHWGTVLPLFYSLACTDLGAGVAWRP